MYCTKCGQAMGEGAQFCSACGAPTAPAAAGPSPSPPPPPPPRPGNYTHLPPYWQSVFQNFELRPGQMQTYWNWPAFFFGAFWYLVKGMPAKAVLYFVLAISTAGVAWLFLAIYAGLYGAWDYYLKEAHGKQLW